MAFPGIQTLLAMFQPPNQQ